MTKRFGRLVRPLVSLTIGGGAVLGALFLFFGLRIELDGGGTPHLRFKESRSAQAARIAQHRATQRAAAPDVASLPPRSTATPALPSSDDTGGGDSASPARPSEASLPPAMAADAQRSAAGSSPSKSAGAGTSPAAASDATGREARDAAPSGVIPGSWTDFRGPRRDGAYRGGPIVTAWPPGGLTPLWKQPAGGGYASFVTAGHRAFTIEQRGVQEVVAAYDVMSGRELWTNAWEGEFQESMGGDGPRATPTWADGVLYALGALGEFRALDGETGRVRWRTNILDDAGASNLQWGMSAAPLVVGNAVVVLPGGRNGQSVVAYDRNTGRRLWSALPDQAAYASPMLVTLGGIRQIVLMTAERIVGMSEDGGSVLWSHPWQGPSNGINAAQPIALGDDRLYVSAGYGMGAAVIQVTGGTAGFSTRELWRNTKMKNRFASAVLHEGIIYGLDESILAAVDAKTGDLRWKGGRYGYGQLLLADGHLIVLTEDGDLALVRATPVKHEELARFAVLNGKTWNPPAMANGILLVRNLAEMAAFDLRAAR
ncbi:MAG: PQQ-binding-like beta-propeller repeat protein [Vicinamibacterales bacterium]